MKTIFLVILLLSPIIGSNAVQDETPCQFELAFSIEKNKSLSFYNKNGKEIYQWKNNSVDYIECYFKTHSFYNGQVKIDSIHIVTDSKYRELKNYLPQANDIANTWIKIENCETELNEWMIHIDPSKNQKYFIYNQPDSLSQKTNFNPIPSWENNAVKLIKLKEKWAKVELTMGDTKINGWMPKIYLCSHPFTSCN